MGLRNEEGKKINSPVLFTGTGPPLGGVMESLQFVLVLGKLYKLYIFNLKVKIHYSEYARYNFIFPLLTKKRNCLDFSA